MGGTAGAESEPGRGSSFWFTTWLGRGQPLAQQAAALRAPTESWLRQRHAAGCLATAADFAVIQISQATQLRNVKKSA
jgi:hypothetical protein